MPCEELCISAAEAQGDRDAAAAEIPSAPKYSQFCSRQRRTAGFNAGSRPGE